MNRLDEWNAGKIALILKKVLVLLTKKAGEKYNFIGIPDTYKNAWGRFMGYWVVSSKKKVFRFNIRLEKADQAQIVSVDRWKTGFESKPVATMSCEGFGISKIFYSLVDFVKIINPLDTLQGIKESVIREEKWSPQPEKSDTGKANIVGIAANFLGENPSWVSSINSGSFDTKGLVKALQNYYAAHGVPIAGYGTDRTLKPARKAVSLFDDFGGKAAAAKVPVAQVFKSVPEIEVPVAPSAALSAEAQEIIDLFDARRSPQEIYDAFENDVRLMLNSRTPWSGVVAYGPGGTGKTYHAEKVAREEGLSEGIGYHLEGSKVGEADDLVRILYGHRETPLVIFDDADSIFGTEGKENILKHALDSANPYIQVSSTKIKDDAGEKIEPGKYVIESKFVINTNKTLDEIGKSDALLSRCKAHNFAFSNDEMKELLRTRFFALAQDLDSESSDTLDMSDCDFILNIFQSLIDGRKLGRFSFRLLKNVLFDYTLAKLQGSDKRKAVILGIQASPTR
jgi:hypothetical protein